DQALLLFLNQVLESFAHLHLALLGALAEEVREHVLDVDVHLLHALIGDDLKSRHRAFTHIELYHALVEFAFAQLLTEFFASALLGVTTGVLSISSAQG